MKKKFGIDVRLERTIAGRYVAEACVRAAPGYRWDRNVHTGGHRCGMSPPRNSAIRAIRQAVQSLGRKLK